MESVMNDSDDAYLAEWAERVFNGGYVKTTATRRGLTGLRLVQDETSAPQKSVSERAENVRARLENIAKRSPQVIVRISGGGKGVRQVNAHLDYISRNGQIALEDQNGDNLLGKEDLKALKEEWQFGGIPIPETGSSRQAFNIILSMPEGTDALSVKRAVREFASKEFPNHQYAMALHTFDTDPDTEPSPHPHVHLCVKAAGLDGIRLNPRKADLQRWRERFAERLRDHGTEAEATKRIHRFQPKRGERQSVLHIKGRGEVPLKGRQVIREPGRATRAVRVEAEMARAYRDLMSRMFRSTDAGDRVLATHVISQLDPDTRETRTPPSPER
jgi:hypothetical protein